MDVRERGLHGGGEQEIEMTSSRPGGAAVLGPGRSLCSTDGGRTLSGECFLCRLDIGGVLYRKT